MSPAAITIDTTPDFDPAPTKQQNGIGEKRTLLLAPPSVAAHEDRISALFSTFDRSVTDLQMLDRLAGGLATLPPATYDLVLVLTDADGSRRAEAFEFLTRSVFSRLVPALKAGGRLASEDGSLGKATTGGNQGLETREAVLAGLVAGLDGFTKPDYEEEEVVPLRFGLKKNKENGTSNGIANGTGQVQAAPPAAEVKAPAPAGVGFVDFSDDLDFMDDSDDDDLIDESELLTEEDLNRPSMREYRLIPEILTAP
jgi:anamorsin